MITLFGIPNCSNVKKARFFLENHKINYNFHNYKINGITPELLNVFIQQIGFHAIFNTNSTSYRQLSINQKNDLVLESMNPLSDFKTGIEIMLNVPSIIKRPIILGNYKNSPIKLVGFNETVFNDTFNE